MVSTVSRSKPMRWSSPKYFAFFTYLGDQFTEDSSATSTQLRVSVEVPGLKSHLADANRSVDGESTKRID